MLINRIVLPIKTIRRFLICPLYFSKNNKIFLKNIICYTLVFFLITLVIPFYAESTFSDELNSDKDKLFTENIPKKSSEPPPKSVDGNNGFMTNTPKVKIWDLLFRVIGVLIFIVLFFYIVKRFFSKKNIISDLDNEIFKIIAMFNMSPGKSICLAQLGNSILVLGITDNNISLLKEISGKEEMDEIKLYTEMMNVNRKKDFVSYIKEILPKKKV